MNLGGRLWSGCPSRVATPVSRSTQLGRGVLLQPICWIDPERVVWVGGRYRVVGNPAEGDNPSAPLGVEGLPDDNEIASAYGAPTEQSRVSRSRELTASRIR